MESKIGKFPYVISIILNVIAISFGIVVLTTFFSTSIELASQYITVVRVCYVFTLSILLLINIVEFASIFFDKGATKNTLFIALGILLYLSTSRDLFILTNLKISYLVFDIFHFLLLMMTVHFYLRFTNHDYAKSINKKEDIIYLIAAIAVAVIGSVFIVFDYHLVALGMLFALFLFKFLKYFVVIFTKKGLTLVYVIASLIAFSLFGAEIASNAAIQLDLATYPFGFMTFTCLFICLLFIAIYLIFIVNKTKEAYRNQIYQEQIDELQAAILKEQINPHFIFNSLNLIKSTYHKDMDKGDFALDLLSKHLRNNIQATGGHVLISLEEELKNVKCYVDLAKLQHEKDFSVIFNIEDIDAMVPILSIETFVENCIRYSHITEKEDGYIEISSEEIEDKFIIKVIDNGKGFDVNKVSDNSYGIANAKKRIQLLLNGDVNVSSEIGKGTEITISIPKKEKIEND